MIDEKSLLVEVKKYLNKARHGDIEHTLNVVKLIKEILKKEKGDFEVLIPVAYLHDVGYSGLFRGGEKLGKTNWHSKLEEHMVKGKQISIEILSKLRFPKRLIERISLMVGVHDDWYNKSDYEVGIFMDADNLSKLDAKHVREKFDDPKDVIEMWERDMPKRLKTKTGKKLYPELMAKLKKELGIE